MSNVKSRSTDNNMIEASDIISAVPAECLEDPGFIKVLATSLLSEIATLELILNESDGEIKALRDNVAKGVETRKVLKELTRVFTKKNTVLNTAFESLERDAKYRSIEVAVVKDRLDDASLREIADRNQFKKLLNDYQAMWQSYQANYEERPLAKERYNAYVTLKQHRAQLMMAEYEKENIITMLKLRKKIDNMRVKASIVKISEMVLERWKDQKQLQNLNEVAKQLQHKLEVHTRELAQLEQEEERRKRKKIQSVMMPPPKLDFSFVRSICNEQGNYFKKQYPTSNRTRDLDSVSINTLMLEEMCKTPTKNEVTEIRRNDDQTLEDEEESCNHSTSVSMIQQTGSINPISKQNDKSSTSESIANQQDIHNKLNKRRIQKKITFTLDGEAQKRQEECSDIDKNIDSDTNNDRIENDRSYYEHSLVESHQRTLRWCKESQDECAPFLLSGQRSNSLNGRSREFLSWEKEGNKPVEKKIPKASSIHGSETKSLRLSERDKKFQNGSPMEVADETSKSMKFTKKFSNNPKQIDQMETQDQRKRPSEEKLRKNTPIEVGDALHTKEKELQNHIPSSNVTTSVISRNIYETPQETRLQQTDNLGTRETNVSDDNSEIPIDSNCSKPKIRKIETVNFPFEQRPKETDVTRPYQPDISYSLKQYVPSLVSSNLSNIYEAALQEMPQDSLSGDNQAISGFPSLSNWKNWSPPNSVRSLASSISKIGQSKETNELTNPHNQQSESTTQFDFGGFFSMKSSQNPRHIF